MAKWKEEKKAEKPVEAPKPAVVINPGPQPGDVIVADPKIG